MPIAPLNLEASLKKATSAKRDILIVCSGFEGESAEDDLIAAGLVADRLVTLGFSLSNELNEIRHKYQAYYDSPVSLSTALRNTKHGQRLVVAEFDDDIDYCSNENVFDETGTLTWDNNNPLIKRSKK
jgi:phosphosulfolactate phosphohydrolase-like enzyme